MNIIRYKEKINNDKIGDAKNAKNEGEEEGED